MDVQRAQNYLFESQNDFKGLKDKQSDEKLAGTGKNAVLIEVEQVDASQADSNARGSACQPDGGDEAQPAHHAAQLVRVLISS